MDPVVAVWQRVVPVQISLHVGAAAEGAIAVEVAALEDRARRVDMDDAALTTKLVVAATAAATAAKGARRLVVTVGLTAIDDLTGSEAAAPPALATVATTTARREGISLTATARSAAGRQPDALGRKAAS